MALINEILIGTVSEYNGMTMYRKYDGEQGFKPYFIFEDDDTLSLESNIVVNYVEIFKNDNGDEVKDLRKYKYYVVPNRLEEFYSYNEILTSGYTASGGEIVPVTYIIDESGYATYSVYSEGDVVADGTRALGGEIKVTAWHAANDWFLSLARTPIYTPYGIMDSIESTLAFLPIDVPNGFILPRPH